MKLLADVCQLWQVDLRGAAITHSLAADEQERAARFHFERDRNRFVICRAALRSILGGYLDCEPAKITLLRGEHGRPRLASAEHTLEFNVSHSDNLAVIAVACRGPLGVDLEALRDVDNVLALSQRYLSAAEWKVIEAAAPEARSAMFLTCWTRKEAVLKSTGAGLTLDPQCIDVGAHAAEIAAVWPLNSTERVRVRSLAPAAGYIAACVTAMDIERIEPHCFELK